MKANLSTEKILYFADQNIHGFNNKRGGKTLNKQINKLLALKLIKPNPHKVSYFMLTELGTCRLLCEQIRSREKLKKTYNTESLALNEAVKRVVSEHLCDVFPNDTFNKLVYRALNGGFSTTDYDKNIIGKLTEWLPFSTCNIKHTLILSSCYEALKEAFPYTPSHDEVKESEKRLLSLRYGETSKSSDLAVIKTLKRLQENNFVSPHYSQHNKLPKDFAHIRELVFRNIIIEKKRTTDFVFYALTDTGRRLLELGTFQETEPPFIIECSDQQYEFAKPNTLVPNKMTFSDYCNQGAKALQVLLVDCNEEALIDLDIAYGEGVALPNAVLAILETKSNIKSLAKDHVEALSKPKLTRQ